MTWTAPDVIAVVAIGVTGLTGVVGFGVQIFVAHRDRERQAVDSRYRELADAYEQAGRAVTSAVWWMQKATEPDARAELGKDPLIRDGNFALKRLRLYMADEDVLVALQAFMNAMTKEGAFAAAGSVSAMAELMDDNAKTYFEACAQSLERLRRRRI